MKTLFVFLCISIFTLSVFSQKDSVKNKIVIKLKNLKKLKFNKIEDFKYIEGSLEIEIKNISNTTFNIIEMQEHNIVFVDQKDGKEYVPYHQCRGVQLFNAKPETINLKPNETKKIKIIGWECSGGSFDLPPEGKYKVFYRTLLASDLKRNFTYQKTLRQKHKPLREKINLSRVLFNSKDFWDNAIYSNSLSVEFKN